MDPYAKPILDAGKPNQDLGNPQDDLILTHSPCEVCLMYLSTSTYSHSAQVRRIGNLPLLAPFPRKKQAYKATLWG